MFQFSGFAHLSVYYLFKIVGCPIQVSTDQVVCADPRSFSQLITPFIASESQGIPHTPLFCLLFFLVDGFWLLVDGQVPQQTTVNRQLLCSFYFLNFLISICQWTLFGCLFVAVCWWNKPTTYNCQPTTKFVENNGVEPLTSCVQGRRSSQLS